MLETSTQPLIEGHDLVMFDLDGVLYVSGHAIEGAPERVGRVRGAGTHVAFVTNNASRPAATVAAHLTRLGVEASPHEVVTSAQAAARLVRDRFGDGARVHVLGGEGLQAACAELELMTVADPDEADVVVSGYGPDVLWKDVMRAATAIRSGVAYVASNTDLSLPTDRGPAPGHGVLVRAISDFAGVEPIVAGKPAPPLMEETVRRVGGERPLMVGDRLDTDIEGAQVVGVPSLLVLTGVTGLPELVAARPGLRPTYLHPGLEGLFVPHPAPEVAAGVARLGGWEASVDDGRIVVHGEGSAADWWRTVATVAWQHLDEVGEVAGVTGLTPPDGRFTG